jgi:cytochrome P450
MTVSLTLFALAQHADIQSAARRAVRLRAPSRRRGQRTSRRRRARGAGQAPLLDAIARESLCVHAPMQNAGRIATEDTAIPLAQSFADRPGALQHEIHVRKGDLVTLLIGAVHRDEGIWGADARE